VPANEKLVRALVEATEVMGEAAKFEGDDLVWGDSQIARLINQTVRQTNYMIASGQLPFVKKVGRRHCASRRLAREHFRALLEGARS
jgi:hypothetical protein